MYLCRPLGYLATILEIRTWEGELEAEEMDLDVASE